MSNKKKQIKLSDITTKKVLTTDELVAYTGWSRSFIYKLTMSRSIPFSKPNGKTCFFDREEIEEYLMSAKVKSTAEVGAEVEALAAEQRKVDEQRKGGKKYV